MALTVMTFEEFQISVPHLVTAELAAEAAHEEVFPGIAQKRRKALAADPNPRLSAVAAIVFPAGQEACLLLIERQTYDGVHSGQIGFPGGKREDDDASFEHTARREAEEECGIPGESLRLCRALSPVYIPPSRYLVHPFLFTLAFTPELELEEREVQQAITLPLSALLRDELVKTGPITLEPGLEIQTVFFEWQGHTIWGATAMMLNEIKCLLKSQL